MKKSHLFLTFTISSSAIFASTNILSAACINGDCEALGYTKSESACTGDIIRCPFDTSKVFCKAPKQLTCKEIIESTGGRLIWDGSKLPTEIRETYYIADSINIEQDVNFDGGKIKSAYDSFEQCRNDPNISDSVAVYFYNNTVTMNSGDYGEIFPYTQIETLKMNGGNLTFHGDVDISTLDLKPYTGYSLSFFNDTQNEYTSVYISSILMDSGPSYNDHSRLSFYFADVTKVFIDDWNCETWGSISNDSCHNGCQLFLETDNPEESKGSHVKFCPTITTNEQSCNYIDNVMTINDYWYPEDIKNGSGQSFIPSVEVTCDYYIPD